MTRTVTLVEVAPRNGFQPIGPFIPTEEKVEFIRAANAAGLHRVEIGSFVNPKAIPQIRDTGDVLCATADLPGLDPQILVPNARGVDLALEAGVTHLAYVISASDAHNRNNVRRDTETSIAEYGAMVRALPAGIRLRLNLATTFDCPFDGRRRRLDVPSHGRRNRRRPRCANPARGARCRNSRRATRWPRPRRSHGSLLNALARHLDVLLM